MVRPYVAQQPIDTTAHVFSDVMYDTTLAASTEQTLTCPSSSRSGKWLVKFNFTAGVEVWVANGATATIPGSSFAVTSSEMNPPPRIVSNGDVLHFITDTADTEVSVVFYEMPL